MVGKPHNKNNKALSFVSSDEKSIESDYSQKYDNTDIPVLEKMCI